MALPVFFTNAYGTVLGPLAQPVELPPLGPGKREALRREALAGLTYERAFQWLPVKDREMARCFLSGIFLINGYLTEAHDFAQQGASATAAYWHALMHRREGDYDNANYWFRQAAAHDIHPSLTEAARELALASQGGSSTRYLRTAEHWDAPRFIQLIETVIDSGSASEELARRIQLTEYQLLLDFCYKRATGRGT